MNTDFEQRTEQFFKEVCFSDEKKDGDTAGVTRAFACHRTAYYLLFKPQTELKYKAAKLLKWNCDQHNFFPSCTSYAVALFSGTGDLQKDEKQYIEYLEKSCNGNDAEACSFLGTSYGNFGRGNLKEVPIDMNKSFMYHKKACDLIDNLKNDDFKARHQYQAAVSCSSVASFYSGVLKGFQHKKDTQKVFEYLDKCCTHKRLQCCLSLAESFEKGLILEKNEKLAAIYREKYNVGMGNA